MNILITGTSSGLGFGLAKHYLDSGNNLFGISRSKNEELAGNDHFHYLRQDISDFALLRQNVTSFLKDVDQLDLVILNAGMLNEIKDLKETSLDEIQKMNWALKHSLNLTKD